MKENESTDLQVLGEQARFLLPIRDKIVARWSDLYLNTFGRSAFFSVQRVQKIFNELADAFLDCLKSRNMDAYFETLQEKGVIFAKLGVPFEEVIISLHLFEEVCAESFVLSFADKSKLAEMLSVSAELHSEGLALLASSYFESFKEDVRKITEGLREENDLLQKELQETQEKFFSVSKSELSAMQLLVSGINLKMRNRLHQYGRLQKLSEILDAESYLPKLLKLATLQIQSFCPKGSDVYFGFFDDDRKKVNLYHLLDREEQEAELYRIFFFSELTKDAQDVVYDENKRILHLKALNDLPVPFRELVSTKNQKDFVFLPIRKFREAQGFIFIATHEDHFCKNNFKFFQRVGQITAKAIVSALLFTRTKKQAEYSLLLEEINRKKFSKESIEMTLDFCLGSLMDLLGAERTSLMQYDSSRKELRVCAAKGYKVYPISGHSFKWGEGVAGTALKESKIISIPKMKEHQKNHFMDQFLSAQNGAHEIKLKSLLCVPIFDSKIPLGVVNLSTINFYKDFDKSEIDMAHGVVNRMASILKDISLA